MNSVIEGYGNGGVKGFCVWWMIRGFVGFMSNWMGRYFYEGCLVVFFDLCYI